MSPRAAMVMMLVCALAVSAVPVRSAPRTNTCTCDLIAEPTCADARSEFLCMGGCIDRGYVFPQCDTVMDCCEYIGLFNAGVTCTDEGTYVRFDCTGRFPTDRAQLNVTQANRASA